MDAERFLSIKMGMVIHDLNCSEPDEMYHIDLAESVRFSQKQLMILYKKMESDGQREYFKKVLEDRQLLDEMFRKYGVSINLPEQTESEKDKTQLRCIRNIMKDYHVTARQAMELLQMNKQKKYKYEILLS